MSSLKLEFLTEETTCLRPVLQETRSAEETAEAIVPENCPDVTGVGYTGGQCFLRGKELEKGGASVSVGVSAAALVQVAGRDTPEVVEVYIPLTVRFEAPALRDGQRCTARAELRRVDGHVVSARKVLIRASVAVTLQVWEERREERPVDVTTPGVQVLKESTPLRLLTAMEEKRYTLEDTVRLSPEDGSGQLCLWQVRLRHTESRLTGARAVFRGEAEIETVSLDPSGALRRGQASLPFSQYLDLEGGEDGGMLRLDSCLTGADLEPTADGGLSVRLQICSTAQCWTRMDLTRIADLYSLSGETATEWEEQDYESLLDQIHLNLTGRGSLHEDVGECVEICLTPGTLSVTRNGEEAELRLPVQVSVLGRNGSGSLQTELTGTLRCAKNVRAELQNADLSAQCRDGQVEITGDLPLALYGRERLTELTGGEVLETAEKQDRPGLVIRRTGRDERLWDIAKQYRTTAEAIAGANGLEGEPQAGTLLLIPGRCGA